MDTTTPLVAVPGLGLGTASWTPALRILGEPAEVVELPGYGVPTPPGPARSPLDLAAELLTRIAAPSTLLGHSASCQVVAHAARLRPDLVRQLVLVGPTTDPRSRSWPALARVWLLTARHEDPRQLPHLVREYHRTTLRSMVRTMDAARHDDLLSTLAAVSCPVVVVRGRRDRIAPQEWLHRLASTTTDATVVDLPAGAHMVPLTHPQLFAERLRPLLRYRS